MTWEVGPGKNGMYTVYDDEGWYLMSCQDEQRARSLANAPQMLEALEEIADLSTDNQWRCLGIADAAIAAVKGEANEIEVKTKT